MSNPRAPAPIKYEFVPSISTKAIDLSGLFKKNIYSQVGFESCGFQYLVERIGDDEIIIFCKHDQAKYLVQHITCYYHMSGAVHKLRFLCPKTNKRCATLFLVGGIWASRAAHGLRVRGGTAEQQRRMKDVKLREEVLTAFYKSGVHRNTKKKAIAKLNKRLVEKPVIPDAMLVLDDAVQMAANSAFKSRRRSFRRMHPLKLSLAGVLQRDHPLVGSREAIIFFKPGRKHYADQIIAETQRSLRPLKAQEDHFCLDMQSLAAAGLLEMGKVRYELLDVYGIFPPADRAVLRVDLIDGRSEITIAFMTNEPVITRTQIIKLANRENIPNRFYLECPINKTLHDKLFLRDGFFASGIAQRLKTKSQL